MSMLCALSLIALVAQPATADRLLLITGLGGEPQYSEAFHQWAVQVAEAAERDGLLRSNIVYLGEKVERDPSWIAARSTKENIETTLGTWASAAGPTDQIFILLIAHGSYRDGIARVNLPGPDMTVLDFAALLDRFTTQRLVFVNASSSSGDFIKALSAENRVIITATRSGQERYETQFGRYFSTALAGDVADLDKDGRVSVLEAFTYARREVERYYEQKNRLATEHAQLDDNADGEGSEEIGPEAADGTLAGGVFLVAAAAAPAMARDETADPRFRALYDEKRRLEEQIAELRARKAEMLESEYERRLEDLLVQLALNRRAIQALEEDQP